PKLVCLEEFKNIDVNNHQLGTSYSSSAEAEPKQIEKRTEKVELGGGGLGSTSSSVTITKSVTTSSSTTSRQ
ncbi:unnamed protein product, partial [Medioppia subpectinata]